MRSVHIKANGAIINMTCWNERPHISIVRTEAEKQRLTMNNKFGDAISKSALMNFRTH